MMQTGPYCICPNYNNEENFNYIDISINHTVTHSKMYQKSKQIKTKSYVKNR